MEPEAMYVSVRQEVVAAISTAISTKRIADRLDEIAALLVTTPEKLGLVDHLAAVLDDASHNHAQRMRP